MNHPEGGIMPTTRTSVLQGRVHVSKISASRHQFAKVTLGPTTAHE